jgi:hypothetical protein
VLSRRIADVCFCIIAEINGNSPCRQRKTSHGVEIFVHTKPPPRNFLRIPFQMEQGIEIFLRYGGGLRGKPFYHVAEGPRGRFFFRKGRLARDFAFYGYGYPYWDTCDPYYDYRCLLLGATLWGVTQLTSPNLPLRDSEHPGFSPTGVFFPSG